MSLALIYRLKNKGYLIFGSVKTETGISVGTDPFIRIAETETNTSTVSDAIKTALNQDDNKTIPHPKNWSDVSKEFLRKSGLKSSKELHKESSMLCNVEKKNNSYIFIPLIHAKNLNEGYVNVPKNQDVNIVIPDSASDLDIINALENAFNNVNNISIENISPLLNKLQDVLVKNNAIVFELLNPGIEKTTVDSQINSLGLILPPDLYELYTWRNGTNRSDKNTISEKQLFPFGIFYSISDAIETYKYNSINNSYWGKKYFPLFTSGGGDFLLINLDIDDSEYGIIVMYSPVLIMSNEVVSIYDSIYSLFQSIVNCYTNKAYFFEERKIKLDDDLEVKINSKINPHSEYWKNSF